MRRDLNGLLSLSGQHLMWPLPATQCLHEFLDRRCKDNEFWRAHELLPDADFMARHGAWRGSDEDGTLLFLALTNTPRTSRKILCLCSAPSANGLRKR